MRYKLILLFLIGLIIIAFISLQLISRTKTNSQILEKSNISVSYQSQIDEKGAVIVEALPTKLSPEENSEFTIKFTTHSVDLNYDFKNISTLIDDKGRKYKPLSWTGGKGGHHIAGTLTFAKLSKEASSVTLTIPGIDKIDRVFTWDLK